MSRRMFRAAFAYLTVGYDHACRLLATSHLHVDEIAAHSDHIWKSFRRTLKRTIGVTPTLH